MPDGSVSAEIDDVMRVWEEEFKSLLNPDIMEDNIEFCLNREHIRKLNTVHEQLSCYGPHPEFDREFTFWEVRKAVDRAKKGKALG